MKLAFKSKVPFVSKAGGHSLWSTIGDEGFILDLSRFRNINIGLEKRHVTLGAGVTILEANNATFREGLILRLSLTLCPGPSLTYFSQPLGHQMILG